MNMKHFICPICKTPLSLNESGTSLLCRREPKPHCFDLASSGYVNLDRDHSGGGDSKECVRHRSAFLSKEYYRPIANELLSLAEKYKRKTAPLLDGGCGEGYYTSLLAKKFSDSDIIGIDISKFAAEHGAKNAKREGIGNLSYAVSSIFELPIDNGTLGCITNVFAPCPEAEFARVLEDNGILIVVSAGERHLMGLKRALYDEVYENEERADMPSESGFSLIEKKSLSFEIELGSGEDIENLFAMTPYYYRTSLRDKEKLKSLSTLRTEIHVFLSVYRKNG